MSNLLQEIEAQIAGLKTSVTKQNVGIVREIGDGVAKIEGLTDCMYNEMIDFGGGVMGLALNLEETEVGAIVLGDYKSVKEGQEVRTTGKLLSVPVGKELLGRVVDSLGLSHQVHCLRHLLRDAVQQTGGKISLVKYHV